MNKKLISLTCIFALAALMAVAIFVMRPGTGDAAENLHTTLEGETDMAYGYNTPRRISPSRAREIMQAYPDAIILDVRTRREFDEERIPGAILLPDYAVNELAPDMLPDKNAIILVYCRAGNRSQSAAKALVGMGYTSVYDFGGIISWPYERE